jgi:hypothetical protein
MIHSILFFLSIHNIIKKKKKNLPFLSPSSITPFANAFECF